MEVEMSAKRLYYILAALAALLTLGGQAAFAAMAPHAAQPSANLNIDSATRSYMAWAAEQAMSEAEALDFALENRAHG